MTERLYQPDFSCIFGKDFADAFLYAQIDSLVWPIFEDIKKSELLKNLLKLKNNDNREYFYTRKISIEDEKVELGCSNVSIVLIQAMDLGRKYGISNADVVSVVKSDPKLFKGILSYNPISGADVVSDLLKLEKDIPVVGIALYPSYTKLDLSNENDSLKKLLAHCKSKNYFVKIDIGNLFLPENYAEYTSYERIKTFLSQHQDTFFILSGVDISGDFNLYYQLLKYYNNLWIEIDPRAFGGMTPTSCFTKIFNVNGFIQNCWHRITIGSATPTLEMSQIVRGFIEATDDLPFAQRCILNTWAFRNLNRLKKSLYDSQQIPETKIILSINETAIIENSNEINLSYKVNLRSYSVTQLLFLTNVIKQIFEIASKKHPELKNGTLFIRSYHTTTSLIVNEHEFGNYLDLHYNFAEISKQDASSHLHTVRALENRADFNHYDHELASTYGNRELTLPIINGKLEIGGRENFYILVTFGPRTFNLHVNIRLLKSQ